MNLRDEIATTLKSFGLDISHWVAADAVLRLLREGPWFDEAVERMIFPWLDYGPQGTQPLLTVSDLRERFAHLLRAALGEDTE